MSVIFFTCAWYNSTVWAQELDLAIINNLNQDIIGEKDSQLNLKRESVIAHGGGTFQGFQTSNSYEAVIQSINNGFQLIELDMDLSSDQKIIMIHDWDQTASRYYGRTFEKPISRTQFLSLKVYGSYEVLTFEKLEDILKENPSVRIVTDTKGDNVDLLRRLAERYPESVKQIVPQIYEYDQWNQVKELGYQDIILTLYAMPTVDENQLIRFAKEKDLYAVTMPDYLADKGLCTSVSKAGIPVYVHPVDDYEEASSYMNQGATGIYSGALLPAEFEGFESEYYLGVIQASGKIEKLTDQSFSEWNRITLVGDIADKNVVYKLDETAFDEENTFASKIEIGEHKLTIEVYDKDKRLGTLTYCLWTNGEYYRVMQEKYIYRLKSNDQAKDLQEIMKENQISENLVAVLEQSLIVKKDAAVYYMEGESGIFLNGEERLPVQVYRGGKLLMPMKDVMIMLGAESVSMDNRKDISIQYGKNKYLVMANQYTLRQGFRITRLKTPVVLYLNKAMVSGEFCQCITGRDTIEKDDAMIILPQGIKKESLDEKKIIEAALLLF